MGFIPASRAAGLLGMSDDTVRRRVRAGAIAHRFDQLGRLLVDVPGEADLPEASPPPPSVLPAARGGLIPEAVHLHNMLIARETELEHLRALNIELCALLRRAMRPARQTRRVRNMLKLAAPAE